MTDQLTAPAAAPLAGVRVVELCQMIAGPYCGKVLADLGGSVVKIEPPEGDAARRRGPFPEDLPHPEHSALFLYVNANKQGVTLNLRTTAGARLFRDLCRGADILIEDTPPGTLEGIGAGYEALAAENGRLIVTSITPFGQSGPYRDWKAYPINTWFAGGEGYFLPALTADGEPDITRPPVQGGGLVGEYRCGMSAAVATLMALCWQQVSGEGQHVDVSKQEALLDLSRYELMKFPNDGGFIEARTTRASASGGIFPCKDGYVDVHVSEDHQFQALAQFLGKPEWVEDERFRTRGPRGQHRDALMALMQPELLKHTRDEIYHGAQRLGCPIGTVSAPAELLGCPQLRSRGYFVEMEHPDAGRVSYPHVPYAYSETPCRTRRPAPRLGEHNGAILGELPWLPARGHRQAPSVGSHLRAGPSTGMLAGIRILDFTWAWAGPYATSLLALAGAEVLKLESRARLDMIRRSQQQKPDGGVLRSSFGHINLNKHSLTLNLSHPKGVALARDLVRVCDVVVENYRPGVMDKLGLGYRELRAIKPDVIMAAISTRGATGPERRYGGYAPVFASLSGLSDMTGYPDGPPTHFRNSMDICSGYSLAIAVLGAVYAWRRTGRGQFADASASEAAISVIGGAVLACALGAGAPGRAGNDDPVMAPHNCYPCEGDDRWVSIAVGAEEEWQALCRALGDPAWTREERFADGLRRWRHRADLDRLIADWTRSRSPQEAAEILQRDGVAAFPALSGRDVVADPHLLARRKLQRTRDHDGAALTAVKPPWLHSRTPARLKKAGMSLGGDNAYVFGELLGLSTREREDLQAEEVIY